jgi:BirA family biotin operon repressor/biotin-[acetyl-CoA-carboxylase] ligase
MLPREEWQLPTAHLGRRVLVFNCVDSTNTRAAALAQEPGNDGIVILADEQTAGKGQHGRSWHCQQGAGVLLSVLLFPPPRLQRPVILAAWAAVSVCKTILDLTGLEARIKWPNDVLVDDRKVCGILIEQARGTVVGIGLNVNQSAQSLVEAGLPTAASLASLTGQTFQGRTAAHRLITHLDAEYDRLMQGDLATLASTWQARLGLVGQEVLVESLQQTYQGRLSHIGWDALVLDVGGRAGLKLLPETVRHLWSNSA